MTTASTFFGQLLLWGGLLLGSAGAAAQTTPDTTRLHYEEEVVAQPLPAAPLPVQQEVRHVWKLGLNNFVIDTHPTPTQDSYYSRFGLHLAYERQLGSPAWSVLGEVSPALAFYRLSGEPESERTLSGRAQLAGRYYYNLERRLRLGRRTGGFSANYFSLALGAGLGRRAHDTPFYLFRGSHGRLVTPDVALLYGVQRRLGRHGFIDVNVGLASLLMAEKEHKNVTISSSLRVGLLLGTPAPPARLVPADAAESLRPRLYVGGGVGEYGYQVRYSRVYPYPRDVNISTPQGVQRVRYGPYGHLYGEGYGTYRDYQTALPYLYAGYYLTPRLAVQLGVQREAYHQDNSTFFDMPTGSFSVANGRFESRHLAVPALLRYALTPAFLRRWQVDALGGLVPVWSSAEFREYSIVNQQITDQQTFGFRRRTFGVHGSLGFDIAYGFGRRRRVQAIAEGVLSKDLRTFAENNGAVQSGYSLGLRYRFGYQ